MFGCTKFLSSLSLVAWALLATSLAQGVVFHPITREWGGRSFTVEIPAGYEEFVGPSMPGGTTVAFVGAPRKDGTKPMVQLTLVNLAELLHEKAATITLEEFGESMIKGVERRREQWKVQVSDSQLGHVRVKRYAWTGVATHPSGGLPVGARMLGVMYIGIDADIGFSLHTQDLEQYAKEALPIGENSIRTFRLDSSTPRSASSSPLVMLRTPFLQAIRPPRMGMCNAPDSVVFPFQSP